MATISITKTHAHSLDYARAYAEELASELSKKFSLKYAWQGDCLNVKGSGVTGSLELSSDEITVNLDLSLMLRPFKASLKSDINSRLEAFVSSAG